MRYVTYNHISNEPKINANLEKKIYWALDACVIFLFILLSLLQILCTCDVAKNHYCYAAAGSP